MSAIQLINLQLTIKQRQRTLELNNFFNYGPLADENLTGTYFNFLQTYKLKKSRRNKSRKKKLNLSLEA